MIGGGPAGSTAASLLRKEGVPVLLVEQSRFPRHHIGESLQPAGLALLEQHFGLGARLRGAGFARKYGAAYCWGERPEPWRILFDERLEHDLPGLDEAGLLAGPYEYALQVDRAVFDSILLQESRVRAVEVREGVRAEGTLSDSTGRVCGVRLVDLESGRAWDQAAAFVLDGSGQNAIVGRGRGALRVIEDLRSQCVYGYWDGAGGVAPVLGRHIQFIHALPEGWIWFIPISEERTSIGWVTQGGRPDRAALEDVITRAGLPMQGARFVESEGLRHLRDWSYAQERLAGPGWAVIGDAACFVDPILSGGVDFAIRGACNAALAVLDAMGGDSVAEAAALARYEAGHLRDFRSYLRLARYWYGNNRTVDGFFWEAHKEIPPGAASTPLRAFVYLTSGRYAADEHLRVFQRWQEERIFRALGVDKARLQTALGRRG